MVDDFYDQSDYYCFHYLVPLDFVCLEDEDNLSPKEKKQHILARSLQRLYEYIYDQNMIESENRTINIKSNCQLSDSYLIKKTKI